MKKIILVILLILLAFVISADAQEMLKNQDVISMKVAKIVDDIILTKITSSSCNFDLSTSGLIELKNAKVSDKVIKQMLNSSPPQETIINDDIIKMSQAGISSDVIKEVMTITSHNFETSSDGLISLTNAKVPKDIVKIMIENPKGQSGDIKIQKKNNERKGFVNKNADKSVVKSSSNEAPVEYTYKNQIIKESPVPEFSSRPYFYSDKTLKNLERADASIDVKVLGFGYGGTEIFYNVFPELSNCKFITGKIPPLIIKVENNGDPNEIVYLVKAKEVQKDRRRFIISKSSFGGKVVNLSEYIIPLEFKKIKNDIYQILVPDNLQSGEYGFMPIKTNKEATSIKITCFGVE